MALLDSELLDTRLELKLLRLDDSDELDSELETTELEMSELELALQLNKPKGDGCELQVLRETQLWLFSYPQPLLVFSQTRVGVPYQLHCCTQPSDELDELATELDGADELTGDDELCTVPEHTAPFTTGTSAAPLLFFAIWKPKATV